jgi:hypothetical protein
VSTLKNIAPTLLTKFLAPKRRESFPGELREEALVAFVLSSDPFIYNLHSLLFPTNGLPKLLIITLFSDVEGFSTNELKELLQSVVEKREGHKTPDEAIDEVRSSMDALCSCVEDIGTKLEKRQLERPIPPARNDPLKEHSQKIKEMEVETENLLWQVSKKDKDIARLAKALKA